MQKIFKKKTFLFISKLKNIRLKKIYNKIKYLKK